jgi:hypothetical protein
MRNLNTDARFFDAIEKRMEAGAQEDDRRPGDWMMQDASMDELQKAAAHHLRKSASHVREAMWMDRLCSLTGDFSNASIEIMSEHLLGAASRAMIAWHLLQRMKPDE